MDQLVDFISKNAPFVLATFLLSFIANLLQVGSFFRDRKRLIQEQQEATRLQKLVDTYEYVMGLAKRNIKTEEELLAVEADIRSRKDAARQIDERISHIQQAAEQKLVETTIEKRLVDLTDAYQEIVALREQHSRMHGLPDIPEAQRSAIHEEVAVALRRPFELPKAFTFRALLLVLLVFLLPYPVSSVLTLGFLHVFIATFFEAAALYSDDAVRAAVYKYANLIGLGSAIALWNLVLNSVQNSLLSPFLNFLQIGTVWAASQSLILFVSLVAGWAHWRSIEGTCLPRPRKSTTSTP